MAVGLVTLTVGSLFSGCWGMDLGLERSGMDIRWNSEIDPYCCRVLAKHWRDVPNLGDVTAVDWTTVERVDLICGGYPCPAFSQAARGRNVAPDLWPAMRAAIDAVRPRYVLIENVAAHLGRGFAGVLADLDALGFDAEWSTLSACAVGAAHMRRRLFALAYPHGHRQPMLPVNAEMAGMPPAAGHRGRWGNPTPDDMGADDGVPYRLDRLRALGNAVVPQVAELIGWRVMEMAT
jgi:DNA (cytosine-5)-methyltransferase 1